MKRLNLNGRRILKISHLLFVCLWTGGALALVLAGWLSAPANGDEAYGMLRVMKYIDDFIIIPGAMGCLLTGLVYGIWTSWGFFRHRWVTVKWILTVAQVLFGTFFLGVWLNTATSMADSMRDLALASSEFLSSLHLNRTWGTVQASLLVFMVIISVMKPWGKKGRDTRSQEIR